MSKRVLSWGDSLVSEDDCALLAGPNWLNDQIISFFLAYLSAKCEIDSALCLDCSVCYLAAQMGLDAATIISSLEPERRTIILAPVNDNPDAEVALGGSHWTLLVAHRSDLGAPFNFLHLDSAGGGTAGLSFRAATRLAKVIAKAAGRDPKTAIAAPLAHMPRQVNGFDCGCYVLAAAELILNHLKESAAEGSLPGAEAFADRITPAAVTVCPVEVPKESEALRKRILDIIYSCAAESK